ncbi:TorF family putative porin [Achromobacter xylosoxidans]
MKKTLPALPLVFAACFAAVAQAEPTDLGGGFSLSGNAAIVSDYRFRGYSQTDFRPAAQLGIDLTHSSGFYLGNWNSNVSSFVYTDGNLEMDFYGGWKGMWAAA